MDAKIRSAISSCLTAVVATAVISACGEKKSARGSQPIGSQPPIEAPKSTTKGGEQVPLNGGIDLPLPQVPGTNPPPKTSPPAEAGPLKEAQDEDSGYDPVDPKAIEKADFQKRYTGMKEEGLSYTGSSTDYILTYLRLRNEDPLLDEGVKARNLEAARSIEAVRLVHDKVTGDVLLSLKIREGNYVKKYLLAGGLSEGDTLSALHPVKSTGEQRIKGKIKCMDSDGGCETTVARLVIGEPGDTAAVAIVFRESLADIYFNLSPSSGNPEYEIMRKFWINSNDEANTDLRLKEAVLKSYEVVNGRSGFDVQINSYDHQLLSFGGPLLAPEVGTSVSLSAERNAEMKESLDLDGITNYKLDLANLIGSAKIINNNGLGQVRVAVKMRKRVGYSQEAFTLTVMRIIKPTLTPNQENLKLN
ncbi:MAG: hypothetical protein ACXVB1_02470 [Pseudobdellovibrionaceae bacterium]